MAHRILTDVRPAPAPPQPPSVPVVPPTVFDADDLAFLRTVADDTEEAPWMVMGDLQFWSASAFAIGLRLHLRAQGVPCFVGAMLPILYHVGGRPSLGTVAPDTFVSFVEDYSRTSYNLEREGVFPAFVLEVVSPESVWRDRDEKRQIYRLLGAQEYVLFEPRANGPGMLEGYRRDAAGRWVRWPLDKQGRLWSRVLELYLVVEGTMLRAVTGAGVPLRLPGEAETALAQTETALAQTENTLARVQTALAQRELALVEAERERDRLTEENERLRRVVERAHGADHDV